MANILGWMVVALDGDVAIGCAVVVSMEWATVGAGDTGEVEGWISFVACWIAADVSWVVPIESCCVVSWFVEVGLVCSCWDVTAVD